MTKTAYGFKYIGKEVFEGLTFHSFKDRGGNYWTIRATHFKNGELVDEINGFTGNIGHTLDESHKRAEIEAKRENLIKKGYSAQVAGLMANGMAEDEAKRIAEELEKYIKENHKAE